MLRGSTCVTAPSLMYWLSDVRNTIKPSIFFSSSRIIPRFSCAQRDSASQSRKFIIDRVAGEIIRLVASVCVSVRLSVCVRVCPFAVGALLFEPFEL